MFRYTSWCNQVTLFAVLVLGIMLFCPGVDRASAADNQDLHRFLPNDGNSVYAASGLLREWPENGPPKLWQVEIGWGKTAVVEAGGLAFTSTETDDQQWAVCLDPATGKIRWKRLLYPDKNRHFANGPVTSPVIDGDRIYFIPYGTRSDVWDMCCPVICLKTDGTELWRLDGPIWGTEAAVPMVVGSRLYVSADSPEHCVLAALDKMTGARLWTVSTEGSKQGRELGAPASLTYQVVDGIPQVVVATYGTKEVLGVHAETGEVMWHFPYPVPISIGLISTPVAVGNRLFICGGEGKGKDFSTCLQMEADAGKITYRQLYINTELQNNKFNTVAVNQDAVFGFGGNRTAGFLHCTDLDDGRLLWKVASREWTNLQNLIIADNLIFALTKTNQLVMAEANRERYHERGRVQLDIELGRPQQPTLANGRLYLRGLKSVVCYQVTP